MAQPGGFSNVKSAAEMMENYPSRRPHKTPELFLKLFLSVAWAFLVVPKN
jgi:hypothetical protein